MIRQPYADFLRDHFGPDLQVAHANDASRRYGAVIVELRDLAWLEAVVKNFLFFLQGAFNLHIVHGTHNRDVAARMAAQWHADAIPVEAMNIDIAGYNALITSESFWSPFAHYDRVLIFQADAVAVDVLDPRFFEYDLIGAPCGEGGWILNGGLSLRNPRLMLQALSEFECGTMQEDTYFTDAARKLGARLPDNMTAATFALESFHIAHPFGVHGTDKRYHPDAVALAVTAEGAECAQWLKKRR